MSLNLTPVQLDDICHKLETGRFVTQEEAKNMYCDLVEFHNKRIPPVEQTVEVRVRVPVFSNLPKVLP